MYTQLTLKDEDGLSVVSDATAADEIGVRLSVGVDKRGAVDFNGHLNRHSLNRVVSHGLRLCIRLSMIKGADLQN